MCVAIEESNILITSVIDNLALPFLVALGTYWLISKKDEDEKKRNYSRLGVAIIEALLEEVENGIKTLDGAKQSGKVSANTLPRKSWSGMSTIPDEVLLRILEVSKNVTPKSFQPKEIRIHCKNYFDHMTPTWDDVILKKLKPSQCLDTYIEATNGVLAMLKQTKELLSENSNKWFPG